MRGKENIDPTLRALGGRALYQWLQVLVINVGAFGAAYQLLDNIFIGESLTIVQLAEICWLPIEFTFSILISRGPWNWQLWPPYHVCAYVLFITCKNIVVWR